MPTAKRSIKVFRDAKQTQMTDKNVKSGKSLLLLKEVFPQKQKCKILV